MKRLVVAAALSAAFGVHADVVYNWQTVDAQGATSNIGGRLVISDQAWRAGSIDYRFQPTPTVRADQASPVIELLFYINDETYQWVMHYFREGRGFEDSQASYVHAAFGDELDGAMGSGGTFAAMSMISTSGLWTVNWLFTERPPVSALGCWRDVCEGVTGRWVLDQATVPISVPGTLALAALGISLLALRSRRPAAVLG